MYKNLIPMLLAIFLLSSTAYAAEPPDTPDPEAQSSITITDITSSTTEESNPRYTGTLPDVLPVEIRTVTDGDVQLLVKIYEVEPETSPLQLIEEAPVRGGVEYTLREITRKTLPSGSDSREASTIITASSPSDKQDDILPLLPEGLEYSEDGYAGYLLLDMESITTEVESTSGYTYTLKDSREFAGLERNDPAYIPKAVEKNGVTLSLTDIQWTPASENQQSPSYSATAYYTGKASGQAADGYLVTASYSGAATRELPGNVIYTIVYEPITTSALPLPDGMEADKAAPIILAVVLGGLLAVAVVFLVRRLFSYRRKKKHDNYDYPAEPTARPARRKPHALGYMKRDGGIEHV